MSAGDNDVSKDDREDDGDCLLLTLDRSLRRMRCGIMVGIDDSHVNGV